MNQQSYAKKAQNKAVACIFFTFNILVVYERRWSPYPNGAVVGGAGHHGGDLRVPAHAVHRARVPRQLRDGQLAALVPDVHLVI